MAETDTAALTQASRAIVWPFPPGLECFAAWKEALSRLVDCSIPADFDPTLFEFYGRTWQLPEAFLQINGGSPMIMSRTRHVIDSRPNAQMLIFLVIRGQITTIYDGWKQDHRPGDVILVDYSLPYESSASAYEGITLTFDRANAPAGLQGDIHGRVLTAESNAGSFLGAQLRLLVDHIDGLSVDQAQAAVHGILTFAEIAFPAAIPRATSDDASVLDRARRLAHLRLPDPDFGLVDFMRELRISRSKLFRAFEKHGGVQRWLLAERLKASLQTIIHSKGKLKISAVARQHGFRSEAHFSRAFKKKYDVSPSSALNLAAHTETSSLYLDWAKNNPNEEKAMVEAWLAAARVQAP